MGSTTFGMAHHMRIATRPLGALEPQTAKGILSIVKQLRILAIDESERTGLARSGMLAGLIGWIEGSKDPEVVHLAVDTVRMLASHIDNVDLMRVTPGLEAALDRVAGSMEHPASVAAAIDALRDLGLREEESMSPMCEWRHTDEALRVENSDTDVGSVQIAFDEADFDAAPVTLGQAREIELDVPMIRHKDVRKMVERVLLRTRGVMSVYLDHAQQKARVAFRGERRLLLTVLRREGIVVVDHETPTRSRALSGPMVACGALEQENCASQPSSPIGKSRLSRPLKSAASHSHMAHPGSEDTEVKNHDKCIDPRVAKPLSNVTNTRPQSTSPMSSAGELGLLQWERAMVEEIARAVVAGTPRRTTPTESAASLASSRRDPETPSFYAETHAIRALRDLDSPAYLDPDEDFEAVDPTDANAHRAAGLPQGGTPKGLAAVLFGSKVSDKNKLGRHRKQVEPAAGVSLWQRTTRLAASLQNIF